LENRAYTPALWQSLARFGDNWDGAFEKGTWDFLSGLGELPHYALVAAYAHKLLKKGRLLDAGCGGGMLADYLDLSRFEYVGFDISASAVAAAKRRVGAGSFFESSIERFHSDHHGKFDAVIFCETVQYIRMPMETIDAFRNHLAENGVIIVSIYQPPDETSNPRIFTMFLEGEIERGRYSLVDASEARSLTHGIMWKVFCLK
jgi:2-polyprenyl-3-methyl-5-hydroxy-6-metoxy-1,4-benzoquinol methylase